MGTRAVFTFTDNEESYYVYKHNSSDPDYVYNFIKNALLLAWELPRFEASEFAAAFIAANKKSHGDVYITTGPESHSDLQYKYEITLKDDELYITAFARNYMGDNDKFDRIFSGSLTAFDPFSKMYQS